MTDNDEVLSTEQETPPLPPAAPEPIESTEPQTSPSTFQQEKAPALAVLLSDRIFYSFAMMVSNYIFLNIF